MPVPHIAHFVWFGDESRKEPDFDKNVEVFRELHPHWEVRYWHDEDLEELGEDWSLYNGASNFFRIEYVKLLVLARHGGLTMDLDIRTFKVVDRLFANQSFYTTWMDFYSRFDFCLVAAEKGSRVIKEAMRRLHEGRSVAEVVFDVCTCQHRTGNGLLWWPTIVWDQRDIAEDTYFWHRNARTWRKHPRDGPGFSKL